MRDRWKDEQRERWKLTAWVFLCIIVGLVWCASLLFDADDCAAKGGVLVRGIVRYTWECVPRR